MDADGPVWQTYFFASESDPPRALQSKFYKDLKSQLRWEIVMYTLGRKTINCKACGNREIVPTEKGVDVGLATKMLILAFNRAYETAILIAGDKDFLETVKFVKNLGLRVEVFGWRGGTSAELAAESSVPVKYLDDIRASIERQ